MGFFRRRREEPVYTLPEEFTGGFMQPLSSKLLTIDIGSKLVVQDGWSAVIVAKDKALDVFGAGEHKLTIPNIPLSTAKLALDKSRVVRHHRRPEIVFPKEFRCDIYFVNMGEFRDQQWQTHKLLLKDNKYGRFLVDLGGTYDFQCVDAADAMKLFLLERGFIKVGYAQKKLQMHMTDFSEQMLRCMRPASPEILRDKQKIASLLRAYLTKIFKRYGISITNFEVSAVNFDKSVASQLGENMARRLEFEERNLHEHKKQDVDTVSDIVDNSGIEPEEDYVTVTKSKDKQKQTNEISDSIDRIILKSSSKKGTKEVNATLDLTTKKPKVAPKEDKPIASTQRRCPKCGKVCGKNEIICECGCILDE
ncbi:MAG: SPFH domain-containing protein [Clostridia bacterium]|nr:SPFH domain-containing protein [Clostridia bacterium]